MNLQVGGRQVAGSMAIVGCGLVAACSIDDGILGGLVRDGLDGSAVVTQDGTSTAPQDGATGADASESSVTAPTDSGGGMSCAQGAPRVGAVFGNGTQSYERCAAALSAATFLNALCTCHDVEVADSLKTAAFDSAKGPYEENASESGGAAVGVNGNYTQIAGRTEIKGSLALAGPEIVRVIGALDISGDWHVAADVLGAGTTSVARNAWLGGAFVGASLVVQGELHHQGTITAIVGLAYGSEKQETVPVSPPCACSEENLLAIDAIIDSAASADRQAGALTPESLESIAKDTSVTLDCGRYFLNSVSGYGNVVLDVQGQAIVFVGDSIDLQGSLEVRLAPGAEIDLFVRRDVHVSGPAIFGDRNRPAATRIYVGGTAEIALGAEFVGNLYAPRARATVSNATTVWGSLFVSGLASSGSASFLYDRAVLRVPSNCGVSPATAGCAKCGWCPGGTACIDNTCAPCRTDDDCCSQFVCSAGSCTPLEIH